MVLQKRFIDFAESELREKTSCVKLTLTDNSIKVIESGVAVKLVNDFWLSNNNGIG